MLASEFPSHGTSLLKFTRRGGVKPNMQFTLSRAEIRQLTPQREVFRQPFVKQRGNAQQWIEQQKQ
jgi:hypothetical protein